MLVLSRRIDETIVFPNLGVTIRLLRIKGQVAQVGIDAPPHLAVLRGELPSTQATAPQRSVAHDLANRLNRVTLHLHLLRRHQEQGNALDAARTLDAALAELADLDRDWLAKHLDPKARPSCRALLVDDDANERELLAGLLRMNGAACDTVGDGDAALAYLASHDRPDVVLLDMVMPRCDGPRTLERIRHDPRLAGLRVYGVSGLSPEQAGIATGPGGVDGWFAKPLQPDRLWRALVAPMPA